MQDYKEHIAVLRLMREGLESTGGTGVSTVDAAIEIMNAAEPQDEAAERTVCAEFLDDTIGWYEASQGYRIGRLMELRAQARAEGYAQGAARYQTAQITLSNQLSAAQTEIARLKSGQTKLYGTGLSWFDRCDELETKLTNLRTAAERHLENNPTGNGVLKFRAAIEASR